MTHPVEFVLFEWKSGWSWSPVKQPVMFFFWWFSWDPIFSTIFSIRNLTKPPFFHRNLTKPPFFPGKMPKMKLLQCPKSRSHEALAGEWSLTGLPISIRAMCDEPYVVPQQGEPGKKSLWSFFLDGIVLIGSYLNGCVFFWMVSVFFNSDWISDQ